MMPDCDFCNGPGAAWRCPARDVETTVETPKGTVTVQSTGEWLACATCAVLVASGHRDQLLDRAMSRALSITVDVPVGANRGRINDTTRAALRAIHDNFWKSREGAPEQITTTKGEDDAC